MLQNKKIVPRRRDVATMVAAIHGVTADYVRKVIRGERENDQILATHMRFIADPSFNGRVFLFPLQKSKTREIYTFRFSFLYG